MVDLSRLNASIPIVDDKGRPSGAFQRFWQRTVESIETADALQQDQIADIAQAQADIVTAQAAADAAQDDAIQALTDAATASNSLLAHTLAPNPHPGYVLKDVGPAWTAATGTAARSGFATYTAPTISGTYTQSEVQALADHVQILSRALKAMIDDLQANGALT